MLSEAAVIISESPFDVIAEMDSHFLLALNTSRAVRKEVWKHFFEIIGFVVIGMSLSRSTEVANRLTTMPDGICAFFSFLPQIGRVPQH